MSTDLNAYRSQVMEAGAKAPAPSDDGEAFKNPVVPDGNYNVRITKIDEKKKSEEIFGIYVKFKVMDGMQKDKQFGEYYSLKHPNPIAVEIGAKKLHSLYSAIGDVPSETDEMLGKTLTVAVASKETDNPKYKWDTSVIRYAKLVVPAAPAAPVNADEIPF